MDPSEEPQWIERAKAGDAASFGPLISLYQKKVFSFILGLSKDPAVADELTQSTFIKAWKALPRFRAESSFQTWLFQIALNTVRSWGRWQKIRLFRNVSLSSPRSSEDSDGQKWEDSQRDASVEADPGRLVESAELKEKMQRAMESLAPREKEVFTLRHYQDMPLKEIGEIMGIAEGSVKAHLSHALEKLRNQLEEESHGL